MTPSPDPDERSYRIRLPPDELPKRVEFRPRVFGRSYRLREGLEAVQQTAAVILACIAPSRWQWPRSSSAAGVSPILTRDQGEEVTQNAESVVSQNEYRDQPRCPSRPSPEDHCEVDVLADNCEFGK
jgi:hypothetical protein